MTRASTATLARTISAHLNRRSVAYLGVFSAIYFVRAAAEAAMRPLWHDELYTAYLINLPTVRHLWNALASGVDLMPPLYHLIVRSLEPWLGSGPLALRLPSVVGFWLMCVCLYRYVTRSLPAEFGFAALLLPFCTSASQYMTEARPYGMVLGLAGLALVSWQALGRPTRFRPLWLAAVTLSLTAAISAHYYAVLLILPLAAGEFVRSSQRRTIDWIAWASLAAPLLVLVPLLPLIQVAREFAPAFWTQARIGDTALVYNNWLGQSDWVLVGLLFLIALAPWGDSEPATPGVSVPPATDVVPAAVFLALPAVGAVIAYVTSSGFMWRYVPPGIIGFAILGSYGLARLLGGSLTLRAVMLAMLVLNHETVFETRDLVMRTLQVPLRAEIQRTVLTLEDSEAPVLVASPHHFLELYYYAPSPLRRRMHYVASPEVSIQELGSDTADRALMLLAKAVPLPVGVYPDDLPVTSYYVVDAAPLNWLVRELVSKQVSLSVVGAGEEFAIYRIPNRDPAK